MKKRNIIISVLMVLAFGMTGVNQAKAQIFITEDDEYANLRCGYEGVPEGFFVVDFPDHNDTHDYFTPLGNGFLLLSLKLRIFFSECFPVLLFLSLSL